MSSLLYPTELPLRNGRDSNPRPFDRQSNALPLSYRSSGRMTTCLPRYTCRHSRTHRPGLTSPGRCGMSFHQARIDASTKRQFFGGNRRIGHFANAQNKTPSGASLPRAFAVHGRSVRQTSISMMSGRIQARKVASQRYADERMHAAICGAWCKVCDISIDPFHDTH